jgi:hypothetical protein
MSKPTLIQHVCSGQTVITNPYSAAIWRIACSRDDRLRAGVVGCLAGSGWCHV